MRNAVVTGATGFIGSWLARELLDHKYDVTVIVRDKMRLMPGIIENCSVIEKPVEKISASDFNGKMDVFYHIAWEGVSCEHKNQFDIQLKNIGASLNVLDVAHSIGCGRFIATGTVAEYALCDNVMDMSSRQVPNDFYGAAKVSAHYFMEVRARQLGQSFIWCVVPSVFGEGRNGHNIITYTIQTLLRGEKPVYGNLQQMWDFLYVKDVVKALRFIGERGKKNKVYGIGSGDYRTLKDYVCRIRDVINPALPLGIGESSTWTKRTSSSCVNNYDLKKDTGFQPDFTFEEGIQRTVNYYEQQLQ